jgi:hypothetical protein
MQPSISFSRFSRVRKHMRLLAVGSGFPAEMGVRADHVVWGVRLPASLKRIIKTEKNGKQMVIVTLCF